MAEEVLELSRRDARRIAVLAQLLDADRPDDVRDTIAALNGVAIDFTPVIAPGHHHVLAARIGPGYDPDETTELLESSRTLFELDGVIRPIESLPSYRPVMADYPPYEGWASWLDDNEPFRVDVLERLRDDGPLAATEIDDTSIRPWRSTGWTNGKNVQRMLDLLERRGEVAVAERRGVVRLFDLADRIHPADLPELDADTARAERMRRRLRAAGILRARVPGTEFEPAQRVDIGVAARVEGVRGTWRVDERALERLPGFAERTAILSPLDRLVFDRKRLAELFESDYTLEMYTPAARRRWGYFALPILHGDRVVGKLDATVERDAGRLRIDALHEDAPFDGATTRAVRGAIADLAEWLRVRIVER